MTLPVFLADDLAPDQVELSGAEGRHAGTVRRLQPGEQLQLVDGRGTRATGTVVAVSPGGLTVEVHTRVFEAPAQPRLVLVQALAKGDRGELAVELATEIGVDAIVPWAAARCVVRWEGSRGERARLRWQATAREAAKQSRRSWIPEVDGLVSTAALADRLAGAAALVLDAASQLALSMVALPAEGDLYVVVGPEGGLTEDELSTLTAVGALGVRLGPSVLRTSTAGAAAAAVISARTGRW